MVEGGGRKRVHSDRVVKSCTDGGFGGERSEFGKESSVITEKMCKDVVYVKDESIQSSFSRPACPWEHPDDPHCMNGLSGEELNRGAQVNRVRTKPADIKALLNKAFESGFEGLDDDKKGMSGEDERWLEIVERGCKREGEHYEIPLPLRRESGTLSDSRGATLSRLIGLKKKLLRDPELRELYEACMNDMIERELLKSLGAMEVRDKAGDLEVSWEFNPPKASHFGGIWERVIRMIRRVLESIMTNSVFTDDSLATIFCEVEAVVNGRPLTVVGEDSGVVPTPQKLLNLGENVEGHGGMTDQNPSCVKRWVHIQAISEQFWRRWCREYRSSLQGRTKWKGERRNVSVNDVVVLVDETEPRGKWPLGRVTQVKRSGDGLVRSVVVVARGKEYTRPISKLIMLIEGEELP